MWLFRLKPCQIKQNTKRPRQVWRIQRVSRALLSVFNTSLCCLVSCPFLRVFCDSFSLWLFVYVRKNVWILAFVLGSTSLSLGCLIQGVTSNFYWVILFIPGKNPQKTLFKLWKSHMCEQPNWIREIVTAWVRRALVHTCACAKTDWLSSNCYRAATPNHVSLLASPITEASLARSPHFSSP